MQVRFDDHTDRSIELKEQFERFEREELSLEEDEDCKRFFKLFQESTEDGSRAAARRER
jgi:hypothetical protein